MIQHQLNTLNSRLSENVYQPVLIHGVQGCGKTTLAATFAKRFAQTLVFSLSESADRHALSGVRTGVMPFSDIYAFRNKDPRGGRTLLFVDDTHRDPETWEALTGLANRPHDLFILGATDVADGSQPATCHVPRRSSFVPSPSPNSSPPPAKQKRLRLTWRHLVPTLRMPGCVRCFTGTSRWGACPKRSMHGRSTETW